MTLTIDVTSREEVWLTDQAEQLGLPPAEIVKRLIDAQLPPIASEGTELIAPRMNAKRVAAIALLDTWIAEGIHADAETKQQADQEVEELKRNLNANRAGTGEHRL